MHFLRHGRAFLQRRRSRFRPGGRVEDAALADAAASALGNRAKSPEHIDEALSSVASIAGVTGCMLIIGDRLGVQGDIELETI